MHRNLNKAGRILMTERKLSDWIDNYLTYVDRSEPPVIFHKWCAISMISAMLQRKCRLNWGPLLTFFPNMYIVLVAPSGARKGTAMAPALQILKQQAVNLSAESTTREALIRKLAECTDTESNIEEGYFESHSSITVFAPELTVFLGYGNLQLMSDLCDWYDCRDSWTYDTKNMGTDEINGVYVNIIGGTTPDLIRSTMPLDAIGGGLTSRMIFIFERERRRKEPCPFLTKEAMAVYPDLISDLEQIRMLRGDFKVTKKFTSYWYDWYMAEPDECPFDPQRFSGYWNRRANHIMKLCMIINASRTNEMIIREQDLIRAISLLQEAEVKMDQTFGGVGKYNQADIIHQVMNHIALSGEVKYSDLLNRFYRDISGTKELDIIIHTLSDMKFLRRVEQGRDTLIEHIKS